MPLNRTGGSHGEGQYLRTGNLHRTYKYELAYLESLFGELTKQGKFVVKIYKRLKMAGLNFETLNKYGIGSSDVKWVNFKSFLLHILALGSQISTEPKQDESNYQKINALGNKIGQDNLKDIHANLNKYLKLLQIFHPQIYPHLVAEPKSIDLNLRSNEELMRMQAEDLEKRQGVSSKVDAALAECFKKCAGQTLKADAKSGYGAVKLVARLGDVKFEEINAVYLAAEQKRAAGNTADLRLSILVFLLILQNYSIEEIRDAIRFVDPQRKDFNLMSLVESPQLEILRKRKGIKARF